MKDKRKRTFKNKVIYACRASVSVMLSILLLPILALIGAMVDHANLNLSRSMVENAGELTVNAALANYDTVLKDVYGLFAMSQDYDDLSDNLEEYFVNSLSAYGLIDKSNPHESETLNKITEELRDFLGGITTEDINSGVINFAYEDFAGEVMASSALSNPDVLRNQIVEFMKYRGPAEVGLELLDALNVFRGANSKVEVTNAKTELDESTAEVTDICEEFYRALVRFDDLVEKIQNAEKEIDWNVVSENAKIANAKIYLCGTSVNMKKQTFHYLNTSSTVAKYTDSGYKSSKKNYSESNNSTIDSLISTIKSKSETLALKIISLYDRMPSGTDGEAPKRAEVESAFNDYRALCDEVKKLTEYWMGVYAKYEELEKAYTEKKDEVEALEQELAGIPTKKTTLASQISQLKGEISDLEDELSELSPISDPIEYISVKGKLDDKKSELSKKEDELDGLPVREQEINNQLPGLRSERDLLKDERDDVKAVSDKIKKALLQEPTQGNNYTAGYSFSVEKSMKTFVERYTNYVNDATNEAYQALKKIYDEQRPYYAAIHTILNEEKETKWWKKLFSGKKFMDYLLGMGDKVKDKIIEVQDAAKNLSSEADAYGAKEGQDEYYTLMKSEANAALVQFTAEDVDAVMNQVEAVNRFLRGTDGAMTLMDRLVYEREFLQKDNFEKKHAEAICEHAADISGLASKTVEQCYDDYFLVMDEKKEYTKDAYLKQIRQANVMYGDGTSENISVPKFYLYLISTYDVPEDQKSDDEKDNGKNVMQSASKLNEQIGDDTEKSAELGKDITYEVFDILSSNNGDGSAADTAGGGFGAMESEVGGILQQFRSMISLAEGIVGTISKGLENVRDNLLVTSYLFENFSYATIESEAAVELQKKKEKGLNPTPTVPKTLTNIEINANNNALYGCELEYILYGYRGEKTTKGIWWWKETTVTGPIENVKIVRCNIFSLRFLMNSIFALTDKGINSETLPPAMAIQTATCGYFPYKVAQVIIKICLAMAESLNDVNELMEGKKVPLIKTKDTWCFSVQGMIGKLKEEVTEQVAGALSDLASQAVDKLNNDLQNLIDSGIEMGEKNLNDLMQGTVQNLSDCVNAKLQEAIGAASQAITNAVGESFMEMFTSPHTFDSTKLTAGITDKVKSVLSSTPYGDSVADYLNAKIEGMVNFVINTTIDNESVVSMLDKFHTSVKDSGNGTFTVQNNMYPDLIAHVQKAIDMYVGLIKDELDNKANQLSAAAAGKVQNIVDTKLKPLMNDTADKIKESASEQIDNIKNTVNEELDNLFPAGSKDDQKLDMLKGADSSGKKSIMDNALVSTILSFSYKDYLQLFIFLGLSSNDADNILKRTAEVMELNIRTKLTDYYKRSDSPAKHPADNFSMEKAYTYVTLNTKIGVRPLLMSKKLFLRNDMEKVKYWTYEYGTLGGY